MSWSLANSGPVVYLISPNVFHKNIFFSAPEDKICLLSGEKATVKTSFWCPWNNLVVYPVLKSHNLKVLSQDEEIAKQFS